MIVPVLVGWHRIDLAEHVPLPVLVVVELLVVHVSTNQLALAVKVRRDGHDLILWPGNLAYGGELDRVRFTQYSPDFALVVTILLNHFGRDKHAPLGYKLLRKLAHLASLINLNGLQNDETEIGKVI